MNKKFRLINPRFTGYLIIFFRKKNRFVLTSFWLLGIFTACSPKEVTTPSPTVNTIKKGEKFRVILPENHAESILWKLDDQHNKNCVDYLNSVWHGNEKGVYFHFEAIQNGQDTLNFIQYKFNDALKYTSFIIKVE